MQLKIKLERVDKMKTGKMNSKSKFKMLHKSRSMENSKMIK